MIRNAHALCSLRPRHALHGSNESARLHGGARHRPAAAPATQAAVDCRFCSRCGTGICAACETEIGDLLPWRARDAVGLHPL
jgi:hypothetical protein